MPRQIALLRGINLGSTRRVRMAELRALVEDLGYEDVRTLLQSGNVVFSSDDEPAAVAGMLEKEIAARLGVETDVMVRTRDELADVIERNPLAGVADNPKRYQVSFLSAQPDPERTRALAEVDVAPERFVVSGREVYAWHPDGLQRSRLVRLLGDKDLGVTATARNWNTVTKLLELADEA